MSTSKEENGISDKEENGTSYNKVLTEELITSCLKADKGDDAILKSFEIKDFTNVGDGLLCDVTSVLVDYQSDGHDLQVSYVAKINKQISHTESVLMLREFFLKERGLYEEITPSLNEELRNAGLPTLNIPHCPFTHSKEGEEVIFMEDLRERGFEKYDRREGLDEAHCRLVIKELARLHAASVLLQKKSRVDLLQSYPYLYDSFDKEDFPYESFKQVFGGVIGGAGQLAKKIKGYEKVAHYLQEVMQPQCISIYRKEICPQAPFMVIAHADCWVNNFLFRYGDNGVPEEVMLLDFQLVRRSSPVVDIMCLLYTSTTGEFRHQHGTKFLPEYYNIFQGVLQAGGLEPDFTFDELEKDYERRRMFGFQVGIFYTATVLRMDGKGFHLDDLDDENVSSMVQTNQKELAQMYDDPILKDRLLSVMDDMISCGIV